MCSRIKGRLLVSGGLIAAATVLLLGLPLAWAEETAAKPPEVQNSSKSERESPMHRVYAHLLETNEHPDYGRRHVKPPSWDTFGNRTHFTSLRDFPIKDGKIVGYVEQIDKYAVQHELGDVLWPSYPIVFADNLNELADEIKRRGLFLFDIWGYVPGSGPGGYWQQYKPAAAVFDMLESKLGDHWFGMDNGEQDGRYIGGYADHFYPMSADRLEQYLNFQRHFERMGDELGNKLSTLVSLNFGHHFLKEGLYTTIGAETAQGLPNGQVYYAFIRGAGKQYGVPWFGNASVWNRWGYKNYAGNGPDNGPTKGTSLNLLKRLMYSHVLYNCVFVGFESGWLVGDELSPIGKIQRAAHRWVREVGQPGVMLTPVALMMDFYSGWSFPRHLYTENVYRVWGNIPYGPGDYLTDGVLDMWYPGYQDSSFYHNESGFIAPTPYGDAADCVLSDAADWLLARYPVLAVAGELSGGVELHRKLLSYAEKGGWLVITTGNVAKFPDGLAGISVKGVGTLFGAGKSVQIGTTSVVEDSPFVLLPLTIPESARVIARCGETPAAVELSVGKGRITVLASPFGVGTESSVKESIRNEVDKPLLKPFPLLKHARTVLDGIFKSQRLFDVGEGLSLITCRKSPGEYTLGICNNALEQRPFDIVSHCGPIEAIKELALDQSEKGAAGYMPTGSEGAVVGVSGEKSIAAEKIIAGGDVRIFLVKVKEENVVEIAHIAPGKRPTGRILPVRGHRSIKEEILSRSTFFEHYDSIAVDWRYVHGRDQETLKQESGWIGRQSLRVYVDLTSGINLFPDLRLVNNSKEDYAASMRIIEDVVAKMELLNARDLIVSLHRVPETNFTADETRAGFESSIRDLCARAAERHVTVYLRMSPKAGNLDEVVAIGERVNAPNLLLAPSIAMLNHRKIDPAEVDAKLKGKVGLWLMSAPVYDVAGTLWSVNAPIAGRGGEDTSKFLSIAANAPVLYDVAYANQDEEYLDSFYLHSIGK